MNKKTILGSNKWIELIEEEFPTGKYTYTREVRCDGNIVAIIPFRFVDGELEVMIRDEYTPCWNMGKNPSSVTGGVEKGQHPKETVKQEMMEETGYLIKYSDISPLGTCYGTKSTDTIYHLFAVDCTNAIQTKPKPDNENDMNENISSNRWVSTFDINALTEVVDPLWSIAYLRFLTLNIKSN
ncbi:hypothetical protein BPT24_078 [Tenacibaculum phage pT24]|uniref:Nudix hydrolase domain-containing protein n=1 Tax=Tenacibaculum phage pT24 TaxID=1880590 RepID=A0A1B4XWK7_9CAUD|nr:hypothetical protein HYP10_gp078 [Tenacibaculum phage pT24]BAV39203.1 hypothetical protein BPT24_078 [Tenacibaculum phage pT24]